ncbi:MAG TPA: amino acid ABC transporter substrate-binding protein [Erysipelotrichaceae bacterium]|nr:amino acid ABC transporter substrate-binding protein [Erysipelotrichaceae bacterium]
MKKLILFIAMMMLVACTQAPVEGDLSLKTIEDNGKMIVGFTEYPPMGFKENGEVTGFDIDIAKEVAQRLGVEAEFVYIDWDAKVLELNGKNIDMIWNGLTITPEREEEILFSKPYFDNRIVIISLKDAGIDKIADLSTKKVGVELQSSGQAAVEGNDVFASIDELVKYTTITEAILDLKAGGIDAIVADEIFARYAVSKEADQYQVASEVFNSENYGIGFRLEDVALRDKVDAIIDEMAADGTATEISMKWFGEDLLKR